MLHLQMTVNSPDIVCEMNGKEILRVKIVKVKNGRKQNTHKRLAFIAGKEVRIYRDKKAINPGK